MSKLRTTPNAWQTALDAVKDRDTRLWLAMKAKQTASVVMADLTDLDPIFAPKAAADLRERLTGNFVGRTRSAIEKIVAMLSNEPVEQANSDNESFSVDESEQTDDNGSVEVEVEVRTDLDAVVEDDFEEQLAAPVAPVAPVAPIKPVSLDADLDLILNPRPSLQSLLAELADSA